MDSMMVAAGHYVAHGDVVHFSFAVTRPAYDERLKVFQSKVLSDELFDSEMVVAGRNASEVLENALELIKIKMSYLVSEQYERDVNSAVGGPEPGAG
jgi:hypothetical protein